MKKINILAVMTILVLSAFAATPMATSAVAPRVAKTVTDPLDYGVGSLVVDLDPDFAWDSASIDTIDQVCEGLFAYNLTDPSLAIIPRLASALGTWSNNATDYSVPLRTGITFQDGTPFNATAVKWNFDRLEWLINNGSQIAELYEPLYGQLVINNTEVVNATYVTFHLNYAYVPFVPLLCFSASYMLSPASTPEHDYLTTGHNDVLVGTGPFNYVSTSTDQTVLTRNDNYWRGAAAIPKINFIYYGDDVAKQQALLAGTLDAVDGIMSSYLDQYYAASNIVVTTKRKGTVIGYLGFNNIAINKTYRQAISYGTDYQYIIDNIYNGQVARLNSPIPEGIMYHDPNVKAATFDLTKARQVLIDSGNAHGLTATSSDQDWIDMASSSNPICALNYTYNLGNQYRTDLGVLMKSNLKNLGMHVNDNGITWSDYLGLLYGTPNKLSLYLVGWGPDYNDPSNFINPLFSNSSSSNGAQVNDPKLQKMMMDGLIETNTTARKQLYYDMQEYIVTDLMPWEFLTVPVSQGAHANTITNIPRNAMGKVYFYPYTWCGTINSHVNQYPEETATNPNAGGTSIPGYSILALLGVSAVAMMAIIYKKRH
jgi:ABC-type transport system substrate-binding protein